MRLSESYFYTLREDARDEDSSSGNLLVRAGMIKKTSAGIYMYLPLGLRVLKKIEAIIREEMEKAGCQELLMPSLLPEDIYIASGRRDIFGSSMFTLVDRNNRRFALGPTHEELFVEAAKMEIKSYKDMPFNLYQIGAKYRDEARPRFGLIRVREFFMKDAYSFDRNLEGLQKSYQKMYTAYQNIFSKIGIDYRIVRADTGAMGGLLSEEFQAVTSIGEDTLVLCEKCDYASNLEVSESGEVSLLRETPLPKEEVFTPAKRTIEEVAAFLQVDASHFVKTLLYQYGENTVAVLLPGERTLNTLKLAKYLDIKEEELVLADEKVVQEVSQAEVGFLGPIGLTIPILADQHIKHMSNFIVGANKTDYHYKNVNPSDFSCAYVDLSNTMEHDPCPKCGVPLSFTKGIEIGNTFQLGDKYAKSLGLGYLDENNQSKYVQMGCYGIGVGRLLAAFAEQHHDEFGLLFTKAIAPYLVNLVVIQPNDPDQLQLADALYFKLQQAGVEVLYDDRAERPGVKFKDGDLIGIPIRITVGKKASEHLVEFKLRTETDSVAILDSEVLDKVLSADCL